MGPRHVHINIMEPVNVIIYGKRFEDMINFRTFRWGD